MELAALRGICEGILADGVVNDEEVRAFNGWVQRVALAQPVWPLTDILERLRRIFADGVIDDEERQEMKAVMESLCGRGAEREAGEAAQGLPLDDPAPEIVFPSREFVVTGEFAFGKRSKVLEAMIARGAVAKDAAPARSTNYLVIGAMASGQWKHESFGRKIQRAKELKEGGTGILIISEAHWRGAITAGSGE